MSSRRAAPALLAAARELRIGSDNGAGGGERRWMSSTRTSASRAWPALAVRARVRALTVHGTDVRHPRTRQATRAVLPLMDLVAAASAPLAAELPGRAARRRALVLPCGVDMERFRPLPRARARAELGLDPDACPICCSPPIRRAREKRFDRARAGDSPGRRDWDAAAGRRSGASSPEQVPLWINAANAVVVPSEREGFGLAVLEALACEVPVLATPVGVHPEALAGPPGHAVRALRPRPLAGGTGAPSGRGGPARRGSLARRALLGRADGAARGRRHGERCWREGG